MQYYKGKALEKEAHENGVSGARRMKHKWRFFRLLVLPGLIIFWMVQDLVYKSLEDTD